MKSVFVFVFIGFVVLAKDPVDLVKNRKIYLAKLAEIEAERDEKVSNLTSKYVSILKKVQEKRTKVGDLEGALAVKKAIQQAKGVPEEVPKQGKTSVHRKEPAAPKPAIQYNAEQSGRAGDRHSTETNVWKVMVNKRIRKLKITAMVAAQHPGLKKSKTKGVVMFGKKKIGSWDDSVRLITADGKSWRFVSIREFRRATYTVEDVDPGEYELTFQMISGPCALAIRKVEIKEM